MGLILLRLSSMLLSTGLTRNTTRFGTSPRLRVRANKNSLNLNLHPITEMPSFTLPVLSLTI